MTLLLLICILGCIQKEAGGETIPSTHLAGLLVLMLLLLPLPLLLLLMLLSVYLYFAICFSLLRVVVAVVVSLFVVSCGDCCSCVALLVCLFIPFSATILYWLVGRSVGCCCWVVGWLVACLLAWLVGWLCVPFVCLFVVVGWLVAWYVRTCK